MNELKLQTEPVLTGATVKAVIRNSSALVYQTTTQTFVTFVSADIDDYGVGMTEQATSGFYVGDFPTAITSAGTYTVVVYHQSGGSLVSSDDVIGEGEIVWDGSEEVVASTGDDWTTLAYVKAFMKKTDATNDDLISDLITAVSKEGDAYLRRVITDHAYSEFYSLDQASFLLLLNQRPVAEISQITLNPHESSPEEIDGSEFIFDAATGEVRLKPTSTATPVFPCGFQSVKAEYTAGYSTVPEDLQLACAMAVQIVYRTGGTDQTLRSETIGQYSYTRASVVAALAAPEVRAKLDLYRGGIV